MGHSKMSNINDRSEIMTQIGKLFILVCLSGSTIAAAQEGNSSSSSDHFPPVSNVLTPEQAKHVDQAVDRGLAWMASRQRQDGAFSTLDTGQPAVTALCVLAYLSRGHLPGEGPYGRRIDKAVGYVLSCQKPDGLLCRLEPPPTLITDSASHTGMYNHGIGGLLLSEVYGMTDGSRAETIRVAIKKAVEFTRARQTSPKVDAIHVGGWRYLPAYRGSDLSITGWQVMFLRSARNAGIEVPAQYIDEAMAYVKRCFDSSRQTFLYGLAGNDRQPTRGMAGAGALSLSLGGMHEAPQVRAAGDWILRHPFDRYNVGVGHFDRFHYGAFYCSHAMFQLGGKYWSRFYPQLVRTLLTNQDPEGHWQPEGQGHESRYGNVYTTALAILALTPPHQSLPIFQR